MYLACLREDRRVEDGGGARGLCADSGGCPRVERETDGIRTLLEGLRISLWDACYFLAG